MTGLAIFKNKHNYVMTYLYIMTFGPTSARRLPRSRVRDTHERRVPAGSFIGFSSAFPKLIVDIFDEYGPRSAPSSSSRAPSSRATARTPAGPSRASRPPSSARSEVK